MKSYVEIDVTMLDREGNPMPCTIARENISYYRGFITDNKDGRNTTYVMVYMQGSPNALKIVSTFNAFKEKVNSKTINIDGLSNDKVDNLKEYINQLKEN